MLIIDIVEKYPQLAEVFMLEYGLHCFGCGANVFETLEDGMSAHGMTAEEIDKIVSDVNSQLVEKESATEGTDEGSRSKNS